MFICIRRKVVITALVCTVLGIVLLFSALPKSTYTANIDSNIIVVDAGHGGIDGGAVGLHNIVEKDINLSIAKKLEKLLTDKGYKVIMTRSEDVSIHSEGKNTVKEKKNSDLANRYKLANSSGAKLFISIHQNQFSEEKISGGQVFFSKDDEIGEIYAKKVMDELKKVNPDNKRIEKTLPNKNILFQNLTIPGILVECGFITNNNEALLLKTEEYQQKIAEAIAAAIGS